MTTGARSLGAWRRRVHWARLRAFAAVTVEQGEEVPYNSRMAGQTAAHGSEAEIPAALAGELGGVQFALLFGSFGTPYFSGQSDVDVAVQFPQPLSLSARVKLVAALEAAIARNVDLVDLRATDPILALQVLSSGRPLVTNDTRAYHQFAVRTLSEYMDLKLDRRPVEEALVQGGVR